MIYRGFEIIRIEYRGVAMYRIPDLCKMGKGSETVHSLKVARRWIDAWLREKDIMYSRREIA